MRIRTTSCRTLFLRSLSLTVAVRKPPEIASGRLPLLEKGMNHTFSTNRMSVAARWVRAAFLWEFGPRFVLVMQLIAPCLGIESSQIESEHYCKCLAATGLLGSLTSVKLLAIAHVTSHNLDTLIPHLTPLGTRLASQLCARMYPSH